MSLTKDLEELPVSELMALLETVHAYVETKFFSTSLSSLNPDIDWHQVSLAMEKQHPDWPPSRCHEIWRKLAYGNAKRREQAGSFSDSEDDERPSVEAPKKPKVMKRDLELLLGAQDHNLRGVMYRSMERGGKRQKVPTAAEGSGAGSAAAAAAEANAAGSSKTPSTPATGPAEVLERVKSTAKRLCGARPKPPASAFKRFCTVNERTAREEALRILKGKGNMAPTASELSTEAKRVLRTTWKGTTSDQRAIYEREEAQDRKGFSEQLRKFSIELGQCQARLLKQLSPNPETASIIAKSLMPAIANEDWQNAFVNTLRFDTPDPVKSKAAGQPPAPSPQPQPSTAPTETAASSSGSSSASADVQPNRSNVIGETAAAAVMAKAASQRPSTKAARGAAASGTTRGPSSTKPRKASHSATGTSSRTRQPNTASKAPPNPPRPKPSAVAAAMLKAVTTPLSAAPSFPLSHSPATAAPPFHPATTGTSSSTAAVPSPASTAPAASVSIPASTPQAAALSPSINATTASTGTATTLSSSPATTATTFSSVATAPAAPAAAAAAAAASSIATPSTTPSSSLFHHYMTHRQPLGSAHSSPSIAASTLMPAPAHPYYSAAAHNPQLAAFSNYISNLAAQGVPVSPKFLAQIMPASLPGSMRGQQQPPGHMKPSR